MKAIPVEDSSRPYLVPRGTFPAFCGQIKVDRTLVCFHCDFELIRSYLIESYAGIVIKCCRCGKLNKTESFPAGEIFPEKTFTWPRGDFFYLEETIIVPSNHVFAFYDEIANAIKMTAPRHGVTSIEISPDGIKRLIKKYDDLTGGLYEYQASSIVRKKGLNRLEFPFAWAVAQLQKKESLKLDCLDTVLALRWTGLFLHVLTTWEHHPRFRKVAKDLGKKDAFFHTIFQLISAAYFYKQRSMINLSLEDRGGEPNPDLYARVEKSGKLFLEVKAPKALQQIDGNIISQNNLDDVVYKCVHKSKDQINREHPGYLVIGATIFERNFPEKFEKSIQLAIKRLGNIRSGLFGVVGVSLDSHNIIFNGPKRFETSLGFSISVTKNETGQS